MHADGIRAVRPRGEGRILHHGHITEKTGRTLFVADGRAHKCYHMTLTGKVLGEFGSEGTEPGQFNLPHGIAVDAQGRVYVGDIEGKRLQRFTRKGT